MIIIAPGVQPSNILLVPGAGEGSHFYVMSNIAKELTSRGHNVTMLVSEIFRDQYTSDDNLNFAFFKANHTREDFDSVISGMTNAGLRGEYISWMMDLMKTDYMDREVDECAKLLGDAQLLSAFRDSNFSVSVVDNIFFCPVTLYLKQQYEVPYVALTALNGRNFATKLDNRSPYNPSYMPELTSGLGDHLPSFSDRLFSSAYALFLLSMMKGVTGPYENLKEQYGISHLSSEHSNAELWLVNTHFAFDFPRPLLPNTIAVGGLTTKPSKPLDQVRCLELWDVGVSKKSALKHVKQI